MAETDFKYDVFISYSHKDEEWADRVLRQRLDDAGLKVCIDYRDFEAGKMALFNMQDAAKQSKHIVLVLTRNWLNSEWSLFEALMGGTIDPAGLQKKLIPLLCEDGIQKDINDFISMRTWVDFTRKDREAIAWKQLFTALGKPDAPIPGTPIKEPEPKTPVGWFLAHPYGMPPNFTGRRAERNMLTGWLNSDKDHPLLILRALGGFGKSALTWHWLTHDVDAKQFPAVVFWSFYEGDASFENFLKETLQYLCVPNAERMNPRQQTEILLNVLRHPGLLLILDGFERVLRAYSNIGAAYQGDELQTDKEDSQDKGRECVNIFADAFLQGIGAFGFMMRSKVLMTTRLTPRAVERYGQFLQGVREEELKEMKKEDAIAFFHAQGIRGTHAEIEAACEPYGYHPLSLRLLAGRILKDFENPADIVVAQRLKIDGDLKQHQHHVLEVSFNSLPPHEQKLLSTIACFRSPVDMDTLDVISKPVKAKGILGFFKKTLKLYTGKLENDLHDLVERGLLHRVTKYQSTIFDLHPIVRRFAYDRLTASDRTAAHTRLVNYFDAVPKPEKVEKLEDLAPVIELYHHMVRAGNLDEARILFRDRLNQATYYQFGAYQLRIELLRALFLDGEDKPPRLKDESAQAWTLNGLANSYSLSGQPHHAVPMFEKKNELHEKMGDKKNLAIGLGNAAQQQLVIGALSEAERNLRRSIDLCREVADEFWEGVAHRELGRDLFYCGKRDDSEQELEAAEKLFEKQKSIQSLSIVWSYRALRFLLMARENESKVEGQRSQIENLKSAIESAQRALELANEQAKDIPIPRDYVRAYWLLGAAYRANGVSTGSTTELTKAEENLSKALNLCRQINAVADEADILLDIARLRYAQGDFKDAQEKASEALMITERSGYVLQGADVNLFLAELALEGYKLQITSSLSDKEAAIHHAKEALKLATCDGPPYYYKVTYEEAERMLEKL